MSKEIEEDEIEITIFDKKVEQVNISIENLINDYSLSKKNKEKAQILDQLGDLTLLLHPKETHTYCPDLFKAN